MTVAESVARERGYAFRALKSRNFRLFVFGQLISLVGTWMQQMAMSWLAYRLTGSVWMLGMVSFLGQTPGFWVAPFGGLLADRFDRRRILLATQTLFMGHAFALAYLALSGTIQTWHLFYLSVFFGLVTGVDNSIRQAFLVDMLDRPEDLSNAIPINSSVFNATRLVGPTLAGFAIAMVGEGGCFLFNGFSYIAVIVALLSMRLPVRKPSEKPQGGCLQELREGVAYAFGSPPIRAVLMLVWLISIAGLPYSVLMPVYAREVLHGGPQTLGLLMGAAGGGAMVGALLLATRSDVAGLARLIPVASIIFAVGLMGTGILQVTWLAALLVFVMGVGMMLQLVASNIILQTLAEDDKRGRVMSLYSMSFLGVVPLGSLLAGSLAEHIGAPATLMMGGALCVLGGLLFVPQVAKFQTLGQVLPVRVENARKLKAKQSETVLK